MLSPTSLYTVGQDNIIDDTHHVSRTPHSAHYSMHYNGNNGLFVPCTPSRSARKENFLKNDATSDQNALPPSPSNLPMDERFFSEQMSQNTRGHFIKDQPSKLKRDYNEDRFCEQTLKPSSVKRLRSSKTLRYINVGDIDSPT